MAPKLSLSVTLGQTGAAGDHSTGKRIELHNLKKGFYLVTLYFNGSTICEKIAIE